MPPTTLVGLNATVVTVGAVNKTVAVFVCVVPFLTVIVTVVSVPTAVELIVKFTEEAPAGTFTVAGAVAEFGLVVTATVKPAVGAGPVRLTVPVVVVPPTIDVGLTVTESSVVANTVSTELRLTPVAEAPIVVVVSGSTGTVDAVTAVVVVPPAMNAVVGSVAIA